MTSGKQKNLKWKKDRKRLLADIRKTCNYSSSIYLFCCHTNDLDLKALYGDNNYWKMHGLPKKRKVR